MVTNSPCGHLAPQLASARASGGGSTGCASAAARYLRTSCLRAAPTRRADFMAWMCSGVVPQQPPTSRTPTSTKLPGVLGHVLRRAEINVASFHRARHAGVGLRRERRGGHRAHPLHARPAWRPGRRCSCSRPRRRPRPQSADRSARALEPSRQLPSSSMVTCATTGRFGFTSRAARIAWCSSSR